MLLAPGTDDLERGKDRACVPARLGFIHCLRLVVHRGSPVPRINDSTIPPRSRLCSTGHRRRRTLAHCLLAERRSARRGEKRDVCPRRLAQDQFGSVLESRTVRVSEQNIITAEALTSREICYLPKRFQQMEGRAREGMTNFLRKKEVTFDPQVSSDHSSQKSARSDNTLGCYRECAGERAPLGATPGPEHCGEHMVGLPAYRCGLPRGAPTR